MNLSPTFAINSIKLIELIIFDILKENEWSRYMPATIVEWQLIELEE